VSDEPAWEPELRREAGRALAALLEPVADRAEGIARQLAPAGTGPGARVNRYRGGVDAASKVLQFQVAYPEIRELFRELGEGDRGAIEVALEIASRMDPESVVPVAERLLTRPLWKMLGSALARALGAASSKAAFDLLIEHTLEPYLAGGLRRVGYAGGVTRAWEVYTGYGDLDRDNLDPRVRVSAVPVLLYLLRFDRERAFPEVVRLLHVDFQLPHALFNEQTPQSDAALIAKIERTPPGTRLDLAARLGVRALLRQDAATALDRLGGLELLQSPAGRQRADALLDRLFRDEDLVKRPHLGTRAGWLHVDPRFAELAAHYRTDKQLGPIAASLIEVLPPERRPPPPPPKPKPRAKRIPAALRREMEKLKSDLERTVACLLERDFRFEHPDHALLPPTPAAKRAITRLKREFGPLPQLLEAFWTIVGSVDLRGKESQPTTPLDEPLVIAPPELLLDDALDNAVDGVPFALVFAPDAVGKAGYSGGTLSVWVPSEADDPKVEGSDVEETLSQHIARCLANAK
jgi:hypothetical protein